MNYIEPHTTELIGGWEAQVGTLIPDQVAMRIQALIAGPLQRLADSEDGWSILYKDPSDQRLWELSYPHSEMHGGGAPSLRAISVAEAKSRYNWDNDRP